MIRKVSEAELNSRGIRCTAVPSLELDGQKYAWLTAYNTGMQQQIRERCLAINAQGRAIVLVTHAAGTTSLWQGLVGTATVNAATVDVCFPEAVVASLISQQPKPAAHSPTNYDRRAAISAPAPSPAAAAEDQTVTIRFRGQTIVKKVVPDATSKQKLQRSYRGQKY